MLTAFGHLGTSCCVHLSPLTLRVVLNPVYSATEGLYGFFQCQLDTLLDYVKLESKNDDEILFVVSIPGLLRAVRSSEGYERRVIKLTKKEGRAYLTFDLHSGIDPSQLSTASSSFPSSSPSQLSLTQDVPIVVLPANSQATTGEPDLSSPTIRLHLPPILPFHTSIDRLRTIHPTLRLHLTNAGVLQVSASDEITALKMHWKNLALEGLGEVDEREGECDVQVNGRKLSAVLHCKALNLMTCIACVVEGECLIVYGKVKEKRGTITYFIPLVFDT